MKSNPVVAIVGVTGAVGAEFMATMNKRNFPVGKLKALASARSAGKTLTFRGETIVIEELTEAAFEGVDIALFSAGSGIAKRFAPAAVEVRRRRDRQLLRVPHGRRRAARDPRGQRAPDRRSQGHHRQSQLRRDHSTGAALADPPAKSHQARDHCDLSGREWRWRSGDAGARRLHARLISTA